jgi:cob(I)alamin adenosyltransferase
MQVCSVHILQHLITKEWIFIDCSSGTSRLYSGERRAKSDKVFMALGAIDELSANLGYTILKHIQAPSQKLIQLQVGFYIL